MTVYETIKDFNVVPTYIPTHLDKNTAAGRPAMGPSKTQLPLDYDVTFFFTYTQGKTTLIIVKFLIMKSNYHYRYH